MAHWVLLDDRDIVIDAASIERFGDVAARQRMDEACDPEAGDRVVRHNSDGSVLIGRALPPPLCPDQMSIF